MLSGKLTTFHVDIIDMRKSGCKLFYLCKNVRMTFCVWILILNIFFAPIQILVDT